MAGAGSAPSAAPSSKFWRKLSLTYALGRFGRRSSDYSAALYRATRSRATSTVVPTDRRRCSNESTTAVTGYAS